MRPVSILIVAAALIFAGLVFFVVPRLMHRGAPQAQAPVSQPTIPANDVLVAARDLPAGTILKSDDVRWQRWPADGLDANFLLREKGATPQENAVGRVVLRGFGAGEPVTAQRLLKPGESGFLAAALTPGMRAVSVHIDAVSGNAGFIVPGDRVDVLLAERFPIAYTGNAGSSVRPTMKQVNSVVLRDVRVLAIDQDTNDVDNKPKVGTTATIEVDLRDAQKLSLATQMGALFLALRSLAKPETAEADDPPAQGAVVQDVDVSPYLGSQIRHPADHGSGLRVYRGVSLASGSAQ